MLGSERSFVEINYSDTTYPFNELLRAHKRFVQKDHDNNVKNNSGLYHLIKEGCIGKLGKRYHIQRAVHEWVFVTSSCSMMPY